MTSQEVSCWPVKCYLLVPHSLPLRLSRKCMLFLDYGCKGTKILPIVQTSSDPFFIKSHTSILTDTYRNFSPCICPKNFVPLHKNQYHTFNIFQYDKNRTCTALSAILYTTGSSTSYDGMDTSDTTSHGRAYRHWLPDTSEESHPAAGAHHLQLSRRSRIVTVCHSKATPSDIFRHFFWYFLLLEKCCNILIYSALVCGLTFLAPIFLKLLYIIWAPVIII